MSSHPITHISDTARWVAIYRAMETERPDAHFRDPFARRLAGPHGEHIVATLKKGKQSAWPMIVRTVVIDEILTRLVTTGGVDTVVNLAAGLDTRPWRMDLPADLRWFDVDLPGISAHKREELASATPRCRLEMLEADLTDPSARDTVLARATDGAQQALVITEGLLVYLPPDTVGDLARALHAHPACRWWLSDIATPRIIKVMERSWGKELRAGNSPFKFAPEEGTPFFNQYGWREAEFHSMWTESLRLKRTIPLAQVWDLISRLYTRKKREQVRRMAGFVLLERTGATP